MRLVAEVADANGVPVLGTEVVRNLLRSAQAHGWGSEGSQVLFKVLQEMAAAK
jgi:3-hydroxyisobutyrate dehydrogenase-like beta-hydroxyacid dehydrogenase